MKKQKEIKWLKVPEPHDYPAAADYLALVCKPEEIDKIIAELKKAKLEYKKAKDVFRASGLPILTKDNFHVKKNLEKIDKGIALSPVLFVVDRINRKLIIADGFHRASTARVIDEGTIVPCFIAYI